MAYSPSCLDFLLQLGPGIGFGHRAWGLRFREFFRDEGLGFKGVGSLGLTFKLKV